MRISFRRGMAVAALVFVMIATLCLGVPSATADTTDINANPVIPGENLGGDLVYDGFNDRNISRFGIYGMAYHLETLTQKECEATAAKSTKKIDPFDKAGKTNEYYLREKGEFEPTGPSVTLQPSDELSVSSTQSKTKSWSVSVAVEKELGLAWIGKLKVTVTGTYGEEVTTSTTDTATAKNPTTDMVQERAYGIYSDVWAVQVRSWRVAWYKAGSLIFAGDDASHVANWYKVKDGGCYRTGYFSTVTVARSKGHGVLRQYPVVSDKSCPHRITSEQVELVPGKKGENGTEPDEKGKKVAIDEGTCVTISGKAPVGDGESKWIELAKAKKDPKTGRCLASPKQLCNGNYWVRSTELTEMNVKPTPLVRWGNDDTLLIRPAGLPKNMLWSAGAKTNNYVYWDDTTRSDRWKLVNKGGEKWQLVNVSGAAGGQCLQARYEVVTASCSDSGVLWRLIFAGDGTFYLNPADGGTCADARGDAVVKLGTCGAGTSRQRWTLAKS